MATDKAGQRNAPRGIGRREVLTGGVGAAALAMVSSPFAQASTGAAPAASAPNVLTIDAAAATTPLPHFWEECIGGDHAKQALRRDFQDQLAQAHRDLGVRRVRMHGILDPQMSVYVAGRNAAFSQNAYSFFNVNQIYDFLVGNGMHPYVEVGFMPADLSTMPTANTGFYYGYNAYPPADYSAWASMISAFTRNAVERYGIQEVGQWLFEVWNEPNLDFWKGTAQEYYKLYQYTAGAIKDVDASLQVGGPATDGDGLSYLEGFLGYVAANRLPLDFVSSHAYENNALSGVNGVADVFAPTKAVVPAGARYVVSETGANYSNVSDELDTGYAGAFLAKTIDRCDGIVDALSLWCFSDIFEEGSQASNIFCGGFGANTIYGVPKPMYRVFEILHQVGTRRMAVSGTDPASTLGALAVKADGGHMDVLLYNHAYPGGPAPTTQTVTFTVENVAASTSATITRIDDSEVNPRQVWRDQGSPLYPSERQIDAMKRASETSTKRINPVASAARSGGGTRDLTFSVALPAEGVATIRLS